MANRVLDLSVYSKDTFDITMLDGAVLHIRKPTQAIVIEMMRLAQIQQDNQIGLLEGLIDICASILSNNLEGKAYSAEWVNDNLDITMVSAIVSGYTEYTKELQSNPI